MISLNQTITRRALLRASPAIVAIAAMPIVANELEPESAANSPAFDLQAWLDEQSPAQRANYHQTQLATAMCEMSPGRWRTAVTIEQDFVLVIRDAKTTPENASVFVQYLF